MRSRQRLNILFLENKPLASISPIILRSLPMPGFLISSTYAISSMSFTATSAAVVFVINPPWVNY